MSLVCKALIASFSVVCLFSCSDNNFEVLKECDYEDGNYSANVTYYNPNTEFTNTYDLEVEVENCEVVQINFPKGGWLDNDHITPEKIDEDGFCVLEGEEGKTYKIQLEPR